MFANDQYMIMLCCVMYIVKHCFLCTISRESSQPYDKGSLSGVLPATMVPPALTEANTDNVFSSRTHCIAPLVL